MRNDRPGIPQLFTSVPALHEAANYLAETTSIFTRCFPDISSIFHNSLKDIIVVEGV